MSHTASLLSCDVVAAAGTDTALQAAMKMKQANIGCVVVLDGGKPVGIFSERDLMNRVLTEGKDPANTRLIDVMTPSPVTVKADDPLTKVFALFARNRFRHLPITYRGQIIGIVSLTDVARILSEVYKEEKYIQLFVDSLRDRSERPVG